jgi:hypothetical protein
MAATNVQAFSGDVEISSNLAVNTNDLFVDTVEGAVGIGTTNPQDVTHIWKNGSNDAHGLLIEQNNAGTGSATLKFGVATTSESTAGLSKAGIFFKRADTNGRGDLLFCMDNADDTNDVDTSNHALTIYRDGNVGIGTNDPGEALHVAGNIRLGAAEGVDDDNFKSIVTTSPLVIHSNADDLDGLGATLNLRSGFNDSESNIMMLSSRSNSNFQYISFATATQERMRIKHDGTVTMSSYLSVGEGITIQNSEDTGFSNVIALSIQATSSDHTSITNGYGSRIQFRTNRGTNAGGSGASADIKGYVWSGGGSGIDYHALDIDVYGDNSSLNKGISILSDSPTGGPARTIMHGNVGIGTTDPKNNLHLFKAVNNQTSGLFIEKQNAGSGTAQITFGVANSGEASEDEGKAGIFFQRTSSNGRGDLKFCIDNVNDANSVGVADCALKITKEGYVQPGQINLAYPGVNGSLGGNYLFQAVYDAYRSGGTSASTTWSGVFERRIQVFRMGCLISIRATLPIRLTSTVMNVQFTWAELGIDGQRSPRTLLNDSEGGGGTWGDATTSSTYLTLPSSGHIGNGGVVYIDLRYLIDVGYIVSY